MFFLRSRDYGFYVSECLPAFLRMSVRESSVDASAGMAPSRGILKCLYFEFSDSLQVISPMAERSYSGPAATERGIPGNPFDRRKRRGTDFSDWKSGKSYGVSL